MLEGMKKVSATQFEMKWKWHSVKVFQPAGEAFWWITVDGEVLEMVSNVDGAMSWVSKWMASK